MFGMANLIAHVLKLTGHRDRDLLELTLSKAMVDLLSIQRVVIARVMRHEGEKRWLEVARLDAKGGGKVADPLRTDASVLPKLGEATDRLKCLEQHEEVEIAWAGPDGPRITYFPLFADSTGYDEGVIEIHSSAVLSQDDRQTFDPLRQIYRNMYSLLAYSDRDALTGLLNRKSLDDAFYSAVLEALDGVAGEAKPDPVLPTLVPERRHRVPANYWLGSAVVDGFGLINDRHGHPVSEEILLRVARIMNNTFRTYDQLYRFGGENFGVLMHCPTEAIGLAAFERFRANVEKYSFPQVGRVTVSCGFTSVQADDSPGTALEKTSQSVAYLQKNGGNKVASHLDLVRRGLSPDRSPA